MSLSPITYHPSPKKAGIFDPYLDTIGGGERYAMTVAEALLNKGWQADIFWPDRNIGEKLKQKFGLKTERVNYVNYSPRQNNLLKRCKFERSYDFLFYFSDGSIPLMFGKKNILHFQVPFKSLKPTMKNRLKLKLVDTIVCNSFFTKEIIDKCLVVNSLVVYPPVDVGPIKPAKKENIILSVGRFSQLLQGKKQDVLVEVFKKMIDQQLIKGWRLVLAGGSEVGGEEFLRKLKDMIENYPIEIIKNPPFSELIKLYGKAKIFWTASGYGVDEEVEPEKVEHFGMTTVEAMAAGCVPIVQGKGGQKEIVENGKNGFLWLTTDELVVLTLDLIRNPKKMQGNSRDAILRSRNFSKDRFYEEVCRLIER